ALLFVGVMGWYASANIVIAIATQAAVLLGPVHPFPFAPRWSWLSLSGLILSESFASVLAYAALVCIVVTLVTRRRPAFAGAVVLSTLALATRWGAIALVLSGVATVLCWPRWPWRRRLGHAAVLGGVPIILAIAFTEWNTARLGAPVRSLRFHPGGWV